VKALTFSCALMIAGCAGYAGGPSLSYVDAVRPAQRILMVGDRTWVIDAGCSVNGPRLTCGGTSEDLSADEAAAISAAILALPR